MIPKIVHISWVSEDIVDSKNPIVLNGLRNVIDMNPDWTVKINIDSDVRKYLRENLSLSDYALLVDRPFVELCDLWRLIKVYNEGGLYIDIDRYYNIPMHSVIDNDLIQLLLPINGDYDFSQDLICSAPGNPFLRAAIDLNTARRRAGSKNTYYLGAQTYMHAITQTLFGQIIDTDPGQKVFADIKKHLSNIPFVKIYTEILPNDTLVYRHNEETYLSGNGQGKVELYRDFAVRHWMED
jgi:mannosyltransferase OCH1-like enzyme